MGGSSILDIFKMSKLAFGLAEFTQNVRFSPSLFHGCRGVLGFFFIFYVGAYFRKNAKNHLGTFSHPMLRVTNGNKNEGENEGRIYCKICDYACRDKYNMSRHLSSTKHKMVTNGNKNEAKRGKPYICHCGKVYSKILPSFSPSFLLPFVTLNIGCENVPKWFFAFLRKISPYIKIKKNPKTPLQPWKRDGLKRTFWVNSASPNANLDI